MAPQHVKTQSRHQTPGAGQSRLFSAQIALDATPHSRLVINSLHYLLSPGHAKCDFLYVLPMAPTPDRKFSAFDDEARQEIRRVVNEEFDQYAQVLAQHQLVVENRNFIEDAETVEEGIVEFVAQTKPDLLVLGMHPGSPQHKGWRISSTSYAIATHAPCSVMVVKKPVTQNQPCKVLFATDGSEPAEMALQELIRFLPRETSEIYILSVVSVNAYVLPVVEPYVNYGPLERAMQGHAMELLARTQKSFEDAGFNVNNAYFNLGDPVDQILSEAEKNDVDLVVMGAHGAGGRFANWLLGSVSARVLEYSPTSVAIFRGL